jgi:hypothetical protein
MRPELLVKKRALKIFEDAWLIRRTYKKCCPSSNMCNECQEFLADITYLHEEILKIKGDL